MSLLSSTLEPRSPKLLASDLKITGLNRDFFKTIELHWNNAPFFANAAKSLSQRLKQVRLGLKNWSKGFSNINILLHNSNWVLLLLDGLGEQGTL